MNAAAAPSAADYDAVLLADPGALDRVIPASAVRGVVPERLRGGVFYGNGPSGLRLGGQRLHPFDGHGYVRALRLDPDGGASLKARSVETHVYLAERAAGRVVERGLATRVRGGAIRNVRAKFGRNVANTCVLPWGDQLLALWEGGHPHVLDPVTLATRGRTDFGGVLHRKASFLAHTRVDPRTGRLVGLCPRILGSRTRYTVLELDEACALRGRSDAESDRFSVVHDFAITERWVVIVENSMAVRPAKLAAAMLGRGTMLEAVTTSDSVARIVLVPRKAGDVARVVPLDRPFLTVHHANAWEEGDRVVLVTCALPEFPFGREFGYRGPDAPLDPSAGDGTNQQVLRIEVDGPRARVDVVSSVPMDFPSVRPDHIGAPTRFVTAMLTREPGSEVPFTGLARLDLDDGSVVRWHCPDGLVGEPLVVPRSPREGDEDVVAVRYGADEACFLVFDGERLDRGPIAEVPLGVVLPFGFHGWFVPPA